MRMPSLGIVLISIAAAVIYGELHDLVTAHIFVEYFTIGHLPIFKTQNPVRLALGWGFFASWWVGAGLGVLLALAAQSGSRRTRSPRSLLKPIMMLRLMCAVCAAAAGVGAVYSPFVESWN